MGFEDLDKAMNEQDQKTEQDSEMSLEEKLSDADKDADEVVAELEKEAASSATSATSPEESGQEDVLSEPAFEYSEVRQSPLYAREETWDEFEDALDFDVLQAIRAEGVRDETKRELHDAVLQHAVEGSDRVAELFLEIRKGNR